MFHKVCVAQTECVAAGKTHKFRGAREANSPIASSSSISNVAVARGESYNCALE